MQVQALSVLTAGPTTQSTVATSAAVVVGVPAQPAITSVAPTVGKIALVWSAPATNALIGTKYTAQVYKDVAGSPAATVFLASPLTAAGTTSGVTTTFSQDVLLPAGTYWLDIATANSVGQAGATSTKTLTAFAVGELPGPGRRNCLLTWLAGESACAPAGPPPAPGSWPWQLLLPSPPPAIAPCTPPPPPSLLRAELATTPQIVAATGSATGATLQVTKPSSISNEDVVSYLIQAYSDAGATSPVGEPVKGTNSLPPGGPLLAFFYSHPRPAFLWFKVTVDAGTTQSVASNVLGAVVGERLAPPQPDASAPHQRPSLLDMPVFTLQPAARCHVWPAPCMPLLTRWLSVHPCCAQALLHRPPASPPSAAPAPPPPSTSRRAPPCPACSWSCGARHQPRSCRARPSR